MASILTLSALIVYVCTLPLQWLLALRLMKHEGKSADWLHALKRDNLWRWDAFSAHTRHTMPPRLRRTVQANLVLHLLSLVLFLLCIYLL